jgi:uncharacterized ferredoxin-like protein
MSGIRVAAEMMELAARTAPKAVGQDFVVVKILEGDDVRRLGERMIEYGRQHNRANFDRDGDNILRSEAVVLIGLKDAEVTDLNCGACGSDTCILPNTHDGEFKGPNCALRLLDMGIALGSAVKTAGLFNVDNRIMYRAGVVARLMGLIEADFVMGVPLSASGKSIYFDRQPKKVESAPSGSLR